MSGTSFFLWFTGILGLIGCVGTMYGKTGKQVGETFQHRLNNYSKDSSFVSPQFKVTKGEIYRVEFKNYVQNNSWMVMGISILDEEDDLINEREAEFWHESGYDSDGAWSERDAKEIFHFKASKSEEIQLEIYWINGSKPKATPQSTKVSLSLKKAGSALVSDYFQYIFAIFGVLFFLGIMVVYGGDD